MRGVAVIRLLRQELVIIATVSLGFAQTSISTPAPSGIAIAAEVQAANHSPESSACTSVVSPEADIVEKHTFTPKPDKLISETLAARNDYFDFDTRPKIVVYPNL